MFLYKNIEFNHVKEISDKLLVIAQEFNPDLKITTKIDANLIETRIPELHEQFLEKNMQVDIVREITCKPFSGIPIHVDGSDDHPKYLGLNWPIGSDNVKMIWWDFPQDPVVSENTIDILHPTSSLLCYSKQHGKIIDELEIASPTLVNIQQYHSADNDSPNLRRLISFRFQAEPLHLINSQD